MTNPSKPTNKQEQTNTTPPERQDEDKASRDNNLACGLGVGLCLGVVLGQLVFHNLALGIALGLCIGVATGTAFKKKS